MLRIVESVFRYIDEEILIKFMWKSITKHKNCIISDDNGSCYDLSESDGEILI